MENAAIWRSLKFYCIYLILFFRILIWAEMPVQPEHTEMNWTHWEKRWISKDFLVTQGLNLRWKSAFPVEKFVWNLLFSNTKTLFRINFCHYKCWHCLESLTNLDGFRSGESATFQILKIGWIEVTLWHFSFGKVHWKFSFPPYFLLISEKRKISKFEPCNKWLGAD